MVKDIARVCQFSYLKTLQRLQLIANKRGGGGGTKRTWAARGRCLHETVLNHAQHHTECKPKALKLRSVLENNAFDLWLTVR